MIKSRELIYIKTDYVFTRKGDEFLRTLSDLEEKRIGITLGYPYIKDLLSNNRITIDVATSDIFNVKKLIAGRIDAFVVEEQSGLKAFRKTGNYKKMQYDKKVPLSKQKVYYAFQNSKKGKFLEKLVSKALRKMKKDGIFDRIMSVTR